MTASEAFRNWKNRYELACHYEVVGYWETPVGITILLDNGTGIPYPYKYEGEVSILLAW